jgi:hypothetical protein
MSSVQQGRQALGTRLPKSGWMPLYERTLNASGL